ncbi:suppressor of fused domain protein [Corynebacterium sanguinis]|uniref:suppressor of fused domain protein n=1 Tax=Corynebacterium sanguinis TaxID=2594913 RepID=UPI001185C70B|nr:suppressor of fused domain protein [Corynebacterium sanguinis]MCT1443922.1 suppressor of fused domain protein [Corynebacterium sanguinis]MCT1597723.1 suppressor of fused domain protein [Corynebacterium sanguinis]QDR77212.1 hypothetical protein E3227_03415 [Corynebacterium sanguinis]TVS24829.1 hypothetical protein EKI51_04075 [Corynebacterium sanguinis]
MTGDEAAAWIATFLPGMSLSLADARPVALGIIDGLPTAVTAGFSTVDTGLVMQDDQATSVRCELICRADAQPHAVAGAVVAATRMLETLGVPAQPGVLLDDLQPQHALQHGYLREPEIFSRGTPLYNEPGVMTLLLELILLSDEELAILRERGYPALQTRLRRRGTSVGDWGREVD